MSGFVYGNGIVHSLTQNLRELPLRSLDQPAGSPAILDDTYSYDANGNVAAIADGSSGHGHDRSMLYDGLDQTYRYDGLGDPTGLTSPDTGRHRQIPDLQADAGAGILCGPVHAGVRTLQQDPCPPRISRTG